MHLSYLANSYFYNYKPSPRILRQHRVLRKLRKNKNVVITKPDKGNRVVILDEKLYNNAFLLFHSDFFIVTGASNFIFNPSAIVLTFSYKVSW